MNKDSRYLLLPFLLIGLTACGFVNQNVKVAYAPVTTSISSNKPIYKIHLEMEDARDVKDIIGDWCNKMHVISPANNIPQLIFDSIVSEFRNRGYAFDDKGILVRVRLLKFYVSACTHNLDYGNVQFIVEVVGQHGDVIYLDRAVGVYEREPNLFADFWTGHTTSHSIQTLEKALGMAMEKFLNNQLIFEAIEKASVR